jgi:hypothetical protein
MTSASPSKGIRLTNLKGSVHADGQVWLTADEIKGTFIVRATEPRALGQLAEVFKGEAA